MNTATVNTYIDVSHPRKDGTCSLSIRVTFDRKHKYYPTGIIVMPKDYERAMNNRRKTDQEKRLYNKINSFVTKANDVLDKLDIFTFELFDELYLSNRDAAIDVYYAFEKKIKELYRSDKIGTAVSYEAAMASLKEYKPQLRFADVSVKFLNGYEKWMLSTKKNTLTTVGIYLRNLRHIWNTAKIAPELKPFGAKKYEIPTGANKKKALSIQEVGLIFNYDAPRGSFKEMARDYWIFMYLCNGMNVKDLCLLKQKDVKADVIEYQRAKTLRKKTIDKIQISLKPQAKEIMYRQGIKSIDPEAYVFPHITKGMDVIRQREVYQQLTQTINKNMKRIAAEIGIDKPITTYYARHSFSTILKRSGASTELISEALGHSDLKTTKSYLDSFEIETLHNITDNLIPAKTAN